MKVQGWDILHFVSYSLGDNTAVTADIKADADWMLVIQQEIYKKYAEISGSLVGMMSGWIEDKRAELEKASKGEDFSDDGSSSSDFDVIGYIDQQLSVLDERNERPGKAPQARAALPNGQPPRDDSDKRIDEFFSSPIFNKGIAMSIPLRNIKAE